MKTKIMELVQEVTKMKGCCLVVLNANHCHRAAASGNVIDLAASLAAAIKDEPRLLDIFKIAIDAYEHVCKPTSHDETDPTQSPS